MNLSSEQFAKLHLFRSEGIGPVSFGKLMSRYGSALECLKALPELAKTRKSVKVIDERTIKKELHYLEKNGVSLVFLGEENYPEALANISDPPPVLTVLGDLKYLNMPQVAVVGNRNASASAIKFTEEICAKLANEGYVITSGMARGIDSAAHGGALGIGKPTIAVLAGGIDHIYPPENKGLYHHITDYGCVVSEMPWGMAPTNQHFPRRNRIISGLAQATLVVEAPIKSGSLITAKQALEQGREVFAVPGFPTDFRSSGPNMLIKQGAQLVETVDDILQNLNPHFVSRPAKKKTIQEQPRFELPVEEKQEEPSQTIEAEIQTTQQDGLISYINHSPIEVDELIRLSGLNEADVIMKLTELEIYGDISRTPSGAYVLSS